MLNVIIGMNFCCRLLTFGKRGVGMKKSVRVLSAFFALMIMFLMIYSLCFISNHTHHECVGEECPICEQIEIAKALVTRLSVIFVFFSAVFSLYKFIQSVSVDYSTVITYFSPIRLKVKMLN